MELLATIDLELLICDEPDYNNTDFINRLINLVCEYNDLVSEHDNALWLFSDTLMSHIVNVYPWNSPVGKNSDVINVLFDFLYGKKRGIKNIVQVEEYKDLVIIPIFHDYIAKFYPNIDNEWKNVLYLSQEDLKIKTVVFSFEPKPNEFTIKNISKSFLFKVIKSELDWQRESREDGLFVSNGHRFVSTSYVCQGQKVYKEISTGHLWYLDGLHKNHFEVFDKIGKHLGEANMDGVLNPFKQDKTKFFKQ